MIYLDVGGMGPGLVPPEQALIPAGDRGFLFGDGLFETALIRDGQVPLLPLHLARLGASARELGIPFREEQTRDAALTLADAAGSAGEHALRITLSRGAARQRGYQPPVEARPTLLVTSAPYTRPTGPLTAVTASLRVNPGSPLTRHKSLSALEKVLARVEAARAGCGEALLLNLEGRVAEGAAANLFIFRGDRWLTPPLAEGCLPGVMRARVIALAGAVEAPLTVGDLRESDGVWLTNALQGLVPLGSLDGHPLPAGAQPPFAGRLFDPA